MKGDRKTKSNNTNDLYWPAGPYDWPPWYMRMVIRLMNSVSNASGIFEEIRVIEVGMVGMVGMVGRDTVVLSLSLR